MDSVSKHSRQLLERTRKIYYQTPISEATERAYLATPRHLFVNRYRIWGTRGWQEVGQDNLQEHLGTLYSDGSLVLFGDDDDDIPSTISQPSFVLRMLDLLQLEPGQTIFELGAGSAWNAALMGSLVGPQGRVYSLEIIPELAARAVKTIAALGCDNVSIIEGDGGGGYPAGAPYDRAIFTAGAYDLPRPFYQQVKDGGLLLMVVKSEGGGDHLFLFRKESDHFESLESIPCGFVQLRGKYKIDSLEPDSVDALPNWADLQGKEVSRTPFWWGGKGEESWLWRTLGIRSFLGITEPSFRAFKIRSTAERVREEHYFGLWREEKRSLVIARNDFLIAYGNSSAKDHLLESLRRWLSLGMPTAASFKLKLYPIDRALTARDNQWIVRREESQFLWSLEALPQIE